MRAQHSGSVSCHSGACAASPSILTGERTYELEVGYTLIFRGGPQVRELNDLTDRDLADLSKLTKTYKRDIDALRSTP